MDAINHDRYYARWIYEKLVFMQPHIDFDGLWCLGDCYYIVCKSLDEKAPITTSGEPLQEWFENCRVMASPTFLVVSPPNGSEKITEMRTKEERIQFIGLPHNILDILNELLLYLPKNFPQFTITSKPPKLIYQIERDLSEDELNILAIAHDNLCLGLELFISSEFYKENASPYQPLFDFPLLKELSLLPSRYLHFHAKDSNDLIKHKYEEDEEFWIDKKADIFIKDIRNAAGIIRKEFQNTRACLINCSAYIPSNIRSYLSLFQRVIINLPLDGHEDATLKGLNASISDLEYLANKGKVQFIAPQSPERYNQRFLAKILDAAPDSVLFSRRLAAISIIEIRKRMPFLFPPFGSEDRLIALKYFNELKEHNPGHAIIDVLPECLSQSWLMQEFHINSRGAMGIAGVGVSPFISRALQKSSGKDLALEFFFASMCTEWAMALNATYFPAYEQERRFAEMCASFYSGIDSLPGVAPEFNLYAIMNDLFMIDNDAPIADIEDICSDSVTNRLLKIIDNPDNHKNIQLRINAEIKAINSEISRFEANKQKLLTMDIAGLIGIVSGMIPQSSEYISYVALPLFLSSMLVKYDVGKDGIMDWIRGKVSLSSPSWSLPLPFQGL